MDETPKIRITFEMIQAAEDSGWQDAGSSAEAYEILLHAMLSAAPTWIVEQYAMARRSEEE